MQDCPNGECDVARTGNPHPICIKSNLELNTQSNSRACEDDASRDEGTRTDDPEALEPFHAHPPAAPLIEVSRSRRDDAMAGSALEGDRGDAVVESAGLDGPGSDRRASDVSIVPGVVRRSCRVLGGLLGEPPGLGTREEAASRYRRFAARLAELAARGELGLEVHGIRVVND